MDLALSTLGTEDIIMLVAMFFAVVMGFSHGLNLGKGR